MYWCNTSIFWLCSGAQNEWMQNKQHTLEGACYRQGVLHQDHPNLWEGWTALAPGGSNLDPAFSTFCILIICTLLVCLARCRTPLFSMSWTVVDKWVCVRVRPCISNSVLFQCISDASLKLFRILWHIAYRTLHVMQLCTAPCIHAVDGEKLRAVLLINPTKSTLLPILNQGGVGQNPRQTSCIWFNRQLILLQSSPPKLPASHLALNHLNQTW